MSGNALLALRFNLTTAANMIRTLDQDGTLTGMATSEPARWDPLMDQLSLAMEPAPGTIAGCLEALTAALAGVECAGVRW